MLRFVARRILLLVPILLGLSILVFIWIRALPGSPAQALLGERATPETIRQINHQYGLDKPIYVQYWSYLKATVQLHLGTSITSRQEVLTEIGQRFPATIELSIAASMFFADRHPARVLRRQAPRIGFRPRVDARSRYSGSRSRSSFSR